MIKAIKHDTLLLHHAVYPKLPHDLQSITSQFLASPPWKSEFDVDWGTEGNTEEDLAALLWYNACDAMSTAEIYERLVPLLTQCNVNVVYENDRRMVDVAIEWFKRGILIDLEAVEELKKEYYSEDPDNPGVLDKLEDQILGYASEAGLLGFNPNSTKQLGTLLFEKFGLPPIAVTVTGKPSTAKAHLLRYYNQHPFIPILIKYRKESKLYGTYIKNIASKLHVDGRLHSIGNITSTPSGRFGFKPAIQNWPKSMRRIMIAPPGYKYVGADYNALELRLFALLAGEKRLIEMFNEDVDVHAVHAEEFFGDAYRNADVETKDKLRTNGKPVTFGSNYGAGADTLFNTVYEDRLDEDPDDVRREVGHMCDVFANMYPMLVAAGDYFVGLAQQQKNLRTFLSNRLRKFPFGGATVTVAKNHPVQGGAGDIANEGTLRWVDSLRKDGVYLDKVFPTIQIHDSLGAEVVEEYADQEAERLAEMLYTEIEYTSPISGTKNFMRFPAEAKVGLTVQDVG